MERMPLHERSELVAARERARAEGLCPVEPLPESCANHWDLFELCRGLGCRGCACTYEELAEMVAGGAHGTGGSAGEGGRDDDWETGF